MKKMCINVSEFCMKMINNKHRLLYNRPTIHSIQRYNGLCELTKYKLYFAISYVRCQGFIVLNWQWLSRS